MQRARLNHYATLGLDRRCTLAQIRAAYRSLAKQHHPDLNPHSPAAGARTQELNAAHDTLSDPELRAAHDRELAAPQKPEPSARAGNIQRNIAQDVYLPLEDFLRGRKCEVRINDPANVHGPERYELVVPPGTAPGTRFRLPRVEPFADGFVQLRLKARPNFRFKVRGADLRCDLRISSQRAAQGGMEMLVSATGARLRVDIPRGAGRAEIIRLPGEGLPKPRGGRGDLLVRLIYTPEVRLVRVTNR